MPVSYKHYFISYVATGADGSLSIGNVAFQFSHGVELKKAQAYLSEKHGQSIYILTYQRMLRCEFDEWNGDEAGVVI